MKEKWSSLKISKKMKHTLIIILAFLLVGGGVYYTLKPSVWRVKFEYGEPTLFSRQEVEEVGQLLITEFKNDWGWRDFDLLKIRYIEDCSERTKDGREIMVFEAEYHVGFFPQGCYSPNGPESEEWYFERKPNSKEWKLVDRGNG